MDQAYQLASKWLPTHTLTAIMPDMLPQRKTRIQWNEGAEYSLLDGELLTVRSLFVVIEGI